MTSPVVPRFLGAVAVSAVLLASLTACGGDDPSDAATTPTTSETASPAPSGTTSEVVSETPSEDAQDEVLDEAALTDALITVDNVPADGFAETPPDEDDSASTGTCLDDISNFDDRQDFRAESKASVEFSNADPALQSQVTSTVESYADQAELDAALDAFLQIAEACTTATGEDADGVAYDLVVATDDGATLDGSDREVNVTVTGTLSAEGATYDARFGFVVASSANNLVAVGASDLGEALGAGDGVAGLLTPIAQAQLDRVTGLR